MRHPWVSVVIKAAVTLVLIGWLLHRIDLAPMMARFARLDAALAFAAIAVMMAQLLLTGWRWMTISAIIGAPIERMLALRLTLIGQFFNQTLPSAIGGDAVRAWLASREGIPLGKAISGVFADRLVALLLLVAIVGATLPAFLARIPDTGLRTASIVLVAATALGVAALIALGPQVTALLRRHRWTRPLADLANDLRAALITGPASALVIVMAIVVHLGVIASVWLAARALALDVGLLDCLVLVPPIVLVTTLPISIAGWGVRESATVLGFGFIGVGPADALALSVVFGLVQIAIGLPGGIVWLMQKRRDGGALQKSTQRPPRSQSP
jgi:glycosyltransferase 2 family protein